MKCYQAIKLAAVAGTVLMLNGCSSFSWSSLSPVSWFSSSAMTMTAQGVGDVNNQTAMTESAISQGLDDKYTLRGGMQTEQGEIVKIFEGRKDDKTVIRLSGPENGTVQRIVVNDADIRTEWDTGTGTRFSDIYPQAAAGACTLTSEFDNVAQVICRSPQTPRISYVFRGIWFGPETLMPSDDILKNWTVSYIVWANK
ncbi:RpoE-regulated lipoprotein [Morganella morganii]|uniref:RpoE-regulated lipoprotein n=1 Tax=Morganella morganii TaxID=582 RepID=A0A9Q4CMI2_MORMO|nr:RpoE-regulated lipoprotein [Morganella morganii]EKU5842320.1 RpoE-regulated lipoprotein [Morganella morganii]MCY0788571.1 RpoE-regulated lipoprotein [Morganella morganii]QXO74180.1 RpoE-regulated lipoprotein [Morganella morganii]HDF2327572.1 RpoE-regulated lipoprotein [Morganella morganii]